MIEETESAPTVSRRGILQKGVITGAIALGGTTVIGTAGAKNTQLQRELSRVNSATSKYEEVEVAKEDGFVQASPFICGMGYHYANPSRVDGTLKITEPEALVYGEDPHGNLMLGAVEYIVPTDHQSSKPDIFSDGGVDLETSESEGWRKEVIPFGEVWTLHAWIHRPNPEGVFHPTNPTEPFADDHEGHCHEH